MRYIKSKKSKPWLAQLNVKTKCVLNKYFATKEEAIEARKNAELIYYVFDEEKV